MSAPAALIEALAAGASFELEGERVVVRAPAPLPSELLERLRAELDAVRAALTAGDVDRVKVAAILEAAVEGLGLDVPELLAELDPEERAEAEAGLLEPELLRAFAEALCARRMRERGERPPTYTRLAWCRLCGPVWLPEGLAAEVGNCPWCFNRIAARPIPRPSPVTCIECRHWSPDTVGDGGGVGECSAGGPEPGEPACFPRAPRGCARFTPRPTL